MSKFIIHNVRAIRIMAAFEDGGIKEAQAVA